LQKEYKTEATTIPDELEGIGCLSTEERRKSTQYNSTTTTPLP